MKDYQMFLLALGLGVIMATLYILGVIPAWLGVVVGWVGGLGIYRLFR